VINMLARAVKRGFEFDYVLFDSWFFLILPLLKPPESVIKI